MNKRAFVKNTAVMTMTSLLLRSLGIVFRIFISNRVGAEGMGLYQLVLSVYVLGGTFASAGLVTAVTRLVAEQLIRGNRRAARWVMRASMALCIAIGLASALIVRSGRADRPARWGYAHCTGHPGQRPGAAVYRCYKLHTGVFCGAAAGGSSLPCADH